MSASLLGGKLTKVPKVKKIFFHNFSSLPTLGTFNFLFKGEMIEGPYI